MDFQIGKPISDQQPAPAPPETYRSALEPDETQLSLINGTFNKTKFDQDLMDRRLAEGSNNNRGFQPQGTPAPTATPNDNLRPAATPSPVADNFSNSMDQLLSKFKIPAAAPTAAPQVIPEPQTVPPVAIPTPATPALQANPGVTPPAAAPVANEEPKKEGDVSLYDLLMKGKSDPATPTQTPANVAPTNQGTNPNYSKEDIDSLTNIIEAQKNSVNSINEIFNLAKTKGMDVQKVYDVATKMTPESFLDYVQYVQSKNIPQPPRTIANTGTHRSPVNMSNRYDSRYSTTEIRV